MTPLQKLILDRLAELDLSYRDAVARSSGLVSAPSLNNIAMGRRPGQRIQDKTLRGIALAIDVPLTQVREAAGTDPAAPAEFRLPKRADKLSNAERRAVIKVVDALLELHEAS